MKNHVSKKIDSMMIDIFHFFLIFEIFHNQIFILQQNQNISAIPISNSPYNNYNAAAAANYQNFQNAAIVSQPSDFINQNQVYYS